MRLFIAIEFDDREFFKSLQDKIDKRLAKMTLAKSYHLTLKFLGEVDEKKAALIIEKLNSIKFTPFSVTLAHLGVFPSPSHINVIWAGFEKDEKIKELQKLIDGVIDGLFLKESDFKAHITLARVKLAYDKEGLKKNIQNIKVEKKEFKVNEFKLIKSTLTGEGPVYEEMAVFKAI